MSSKVFDTPSRVIVEKDEVIQDGPEGIAVSFDPQAAVETGRRLVDGGLQAQRYRDTQKTGSDKGEPENDS